jgi:hypothetical protein
LLAVGAVEVPVPPFAMLRIPDSVGEKVKEVPVLVMAWASVRPVVVSAVEVAKVSAPVCAEPYVCAMLDTPFEIVEVETQLGMPFDTART